MLDINDVHSSLDKCLELLWTRRTIHARHMRKTVWPLRVDFFEFQMKIMVNETHLLDITCFIDKRFSTIGATNSIYHAINRELVSLDVGKYDEYALNVKELNRDPFLIYSRSKAEMMQRWTDTDQGSTKVVRPGGYVTGAREELDDTDVPL